MVYIMQQTDKKTQYSNFNNKSNIEERNGAQKKLSPKKTIYYILITLAMICCITVFKIPYNNENAPLLNIYYAVFFIFVSGFFIDNALCKKQIYEMSLWMKIISVIFMFFGVMIYTLHFDYIQAHMSEWGSFNKVEK